MAKKQTIQWQFIHHDPSDEVIQCWRELCSNSKLISASSTPVFALNANKLIDAKILFALGYVNHQLVTAIPLVIKNTTRLGITINYLQVAVHDHLDYFIAAGQSELSEAHLVTSLIDACRQQIKHWHWFFSRRWYFETALNSKLLCQSYQRQAAFFDLKEKQSIAEVISKKLLKNLNRFEKKLLVSDQELVLVKASDGPSVQDSLQVFYQIEQAGWKGKAGSAISQTPSLTEFYNQCWQQFAETNNAALFELKQADKTIAACIAYQQRNKLFLHKITYDEALSKMSPGSILVKKIIETCIEQGQVNTLCFNTNPPWVQRWHPQLDHLQAVQAFNNNIKGFMVRLVVKLYYLIRNTKRRIQKRD